MRRKHFINWLRLQPGFSVQVTNGLIRIEKGEHLMYLRNQWYYPRWYMRLILRIYSEMWEPRTWKEAYQSLIQSTKNKKYETIKKESN